MVSDLALIAEPGADIDRFLLPGETLGTKVSHYQTGNDNPQTGKGKEEENVTGKKVLVPLRLTFFPCISRP